MFFNKKHKETGEEVEDSLSMRQYGRYILIGGIVGIVTVVFREWIAVFAPADTPIFYLISIIFVYAFGIMLSFILHKAFTFRTEGCTWHMLGPFILVAIIGAVSTSLLAVFFRYWLDFDLFFGKFGASTAFAFAACISSIITYWINARLVFSNARR